MTPVAEEPKAEIDKGVSRSVLRIFDAAFLLNEDAWLLQLAPPGNRFHNPETIRRLTKHIGQAQSGLAALKRELRRKRKRVDNGLS